MCGELREEVMVEVKVKAFGDVIFQVSKSRPLSSSPDGQTLKY